MTFIETIAGSGIETRLELDPDKIKFAEEEITADSLFRNARVTIDPEDYQNIRQSIIQHGILQDPTVRPIKNDPDYTHQVVAGATRLRIVKWLREHNVNCFDKKTGKICPAQEVYKTLSVSCRDLTDIQAIMISVGENLDRSQLDDLDLMNFCRDLVHVKDPITGQPKFTREQVAAMVNRSSSWVSLTLSLDALPSRVKDLMQGKRLTRTAALSLLQTNTDKIDEVLEYAQTKLEKESEEEEKEALLELKAAKNAEEEAEIDAAMLSLSTKLEDAKAAGKRLDRARKRVTAASEKHKAAREKKLNGQYTAGMIDEGNKKITGAKKGASKVLSGKVIKELSAEFFKIADDPPTGKRSAYSATKRVLEYLLGHRNYKNIEDAINDTP